MQTTDLPLWSRRLDGTTVLIVDDEAPICDFLRSAFESEGYTVLVAADGIAALGVCEHYQPDAILLDLMMPRLDGLGFLHEFRRRYGVDACPIVIMSAVSTAVEHAEAAGVAGAIVKPFDLDALLDLVGRALGRGAAIPRRLRA
ncbi:MAG TPA: response regulator [Chloroflexota bacterium]|nr:response regulator [Chloroflexota bacterium]